jgi:hypothetical protein
LFSLFLLSLNIWVFWVNPRSRKLITVMFVMIAPIAVGNWIAFANYGIAERVRAHFIILLVPGITLGFKWFLHPRGMPRTEVKRGVL